jgi:hypothetical protein
MSYVIQNFLKPTNRIIVMPRFKTTVIINSLRIFIFFFKFSNFEIKPSYHLFFKNFFFSKGLLKTLNSMLDKFSINYTNTILHTTTYWSFKLIEFFFEHKILPSTIITHSNKFNRNLYFLSIKTTRIKVVKTFVKNLFFYFIFFFNDLWQQHTGLLYFYLNFFFIRNNYKFYKFFGGYFFKLYNF